MLIVDDVIDADLRFDLFAAFAAGDTFESPMPTSTGRLEPNHAARVRTDFLLDGAPLEAVALAMSNRLLPALERSLAFSATSFEVIKMVRYPVGGHFHPHRDIVGPKTAHRRFAVTINLNDGYTGGGLRFGEFAPTEFSPGSGTAIVFSCGLLHEVRPVTQGERYALVTFLS